MKLMFFSFELPPLLKDSPEIVGGAAVQWKAWIHGFRSNGHDFGLLTWKGAKRYIGKELDFDIIECYDPNKGINRLRVLYYQIPMLIKSIRSYNPDFLIQGSATAHTGIIMLISKILGIKFIHRIANDADVDERISTIVHKREIFLYKLGVKYADIILTQNDYQQKVLQQKYPQKKIFLLHNPVEISSLLETKKKSEKKYIAWVGNFRYIKNLPAMVDIAKSFPNLLFKIAGGKHSDIDSASLEALKILKSFPNVEFVGYLKREAIPAFFHNALCLLNTSHYEGFSNTFLEAWLYGTPVVSTEKANPDSLISIHNLGEVANNHDSIKEHLQKVVEMSDDEYGDLSKTCMKYVVEKHDPKILAEKFINYLN